MSSETKVLTQPPNLSRLLMLEAKKSIPVYSGGVTQFSVTHNLGYIPAFKVFFQDYDNHPDRMFSLPTNYDGNVPSLTLNTYLPFTITATLTPTTISFGVTNKGNSVATNIKIFVIIYAEKASQTT